eukprot:COSAG04_NODE_9084_length_900_cov_1.573034_3_plen_43_part_01
MLRTQHGVSGESRRKHSSIVIPSQPLRARAAATAGRSTESRSG